MRYRQRELDLISNADVQVLFRKRSLILHSIRQTLVSQGFLEVETPLLQSQAGGAAAGGAGTRSYVVQSGDSLSKIAKKFYGDANAWHRIFEANKDRIKNPDLIQPGWKLEIPE
jgi:nucleoid-associated protein YgaU